MGGCWEAEPGVIPRAGGWPSWAFSQTSGIWFISFVFVYLCAQSGLPHPDCITRAAGAMDVALALRTFLPQRWLFSVLSAVQQEGNTDRGLGNSGVVSAFATNCVSLAKSFFILTKRLFR